MGSAVQAAARKPAGKSPEKVQPGSVESDFEQQPTAQWDRLSTHGPTGRPMIQAMLRVSRPDDPLEREADAVADQVMRMPESSAAAPAICAVKGPVPELDRKCAACEEAQDAPPATARRCAECEPDVHAKRAGEGRRPPTTGRAGPEIRQLAGRGRPLDAGSREFFSARFDRDFSDVRIHDHAAAHELSAQIGAKAFASGADIGFARDEYRPETVEGRRLLAHELTHVVQQSGGAATGARGDRVIHRQVADTLNYDWLADRIHRAVNGPQTDEEAVYRALEPLERDREAIGRLSAVYLARHGEHLIDAIAGDFSGDELEYTAQLLGIGDAASDIRILPMPHSVAEFREAVNRLEGAISGPGTEEEVIFAVLTSFNRNLRGLRNLQTHYYRVHQRELRDDLGDDLSGSELSYARYLMGDVILGASEQHFGQRWATEHTDAMHGNHADSLVGLYRILTGSPRDEAAGAVASLTAQAGGNQRQLVMAMDFIRDNRQLLPEQGMEVMLADAARFVATAGGQSAAQFHEGLLRAMLYGTGPGDYQIVHRGGDTHAVPGLVRGQQEFRASARLSSLERPGAPAAESPVRGGLGSSVSLQAGFGTFAHGVSEQRIDRCLRSAANRIDEALLPAVREVANDEYVMRVLENFFLRDSGRLVAMDNNGGRYDDARPPTVYVGTADGVLDTRATLVHELLHYAFDKMDSALGENSSSGGADHPAIRALEVRFVVRQLIRNGIPPSRLPGNYDEHFGMFLDGPDLLPMMNAAIDANDPAALLSVVNDPGFVVTTVSSGLLGEASGITLGGSDYRYTRDQLQDLAALYAQIAVIVRRAMREAVALSATLGVSLPDVFPRREWIHTMEVFQRMFVNQLQVTPTQGVVALGDRIRLPEVPTASAGRAVDAVFNPQQHAARTRGATVPEVAEPDRFLREIVAQGRVIRVREFRRAGTILGSDVQLNTGDLDELTSIGVRQVAGTYGRYMPPGVNLGVVRQRMRFIPPPEESDRRPGDADLPEGQLRRYGRSAVSIKLGQNDRAQQIISRHNVLKGGRDRDLYYRGRNRIYDANRNEWNHVALSFGGWNPVDEDQPALLQRNVSVRQGEDESVARRRGRWKRLGTVIHETLHEATHPDFRSTLRRQEQSDIGLEGFTEHFTRQVYSDLETRTRGGRDRDLSRRIEGGTGAEVTPPARTSYNRHIRRVNDVLGALGNNDENLRQAYFGGHVEYLGLASGDSPHRGAHEDDLSERDLGIQREPDNGERNSAAASVQTGDYRAISQGGEPLARNDRAFFESRFGVDLGSVRIHDDARADALAADIDARAFTCGSHIGFRSNQFAPGSMAGRRLLAHELAHVVQQGGGTASAVIQRQHEGPAPGTQPGGSASGPQLASAYIQLACEVLQDLRTGVERGLVWPFENRAQLAAADEALLRERYDALQRLVENLAEMIQKIETGTMVPTDPATRDNLRALWTANYHERGSWAMDHPPRGHPARWSRPVRILPMPGGVQRRIFASLGGYINNAADPSNPVLPGQNLPTWWVLQCHGIQQQPSRRQAPITNRPITPGELERSTVIFIFRRGGEISGWDWEPRNAAHTGASVPFGPHQWHYDEARHQVYIVVNGRRVVLLRQGRVLVEQ